MKKLTALILAAVLLCSIASVLAEAPATSETAARAVVPENAELIFSEQDDGMMEFMFITPDEILYQVDVNPATNAVEQMEVEVLGKTSGTAVVLTQQQAEQALLKMCPEAKILFAASEREDGGFVYKIRFTTDLLKGEAELNAETGALLKMEIDYTSVPGAKGPLTADEAKTLVLSMVENGRITEFETDRDDGRIEYEGEVIAGGVKYEFKIDADTGAVLEWEADLDD